MQRVLIAFLLALISVLAYAQSDPVQDLVKRSTPNPVPPSPNVASLGKFIDYPVGYFSGIPEISIPIYEVKSGELTVPITLSYHASGIKPTDVASWVGLGWSLSAGGQISRSVRGKPDENSYEDTPLKDEIQACFDETEGGTYGYMKNSARGIIDTDPDNYTYSFPGASGQFMLLQPSTPGGSSPAPFTVPYVPYLISKVSAYKFEITGSDGVLYRYGTGADNVIASEATTATNGGNPSFTSTTSWMLRDIMAPNSNDQIFFKYQSNGASLTKDISYSYNLISNCTPHNPNNENPEPAPICPTSSITPTISTIESSSTLQALHEIIFKTGKVEFVLGSIRTDEVQQGAPGGPGKFLSQIKIYRKKADGTYLLKQLIKFSYTYFTNNHSTEALKLDQIQFQDSNSIAVQNYRFGYFTNSFSWDRTSNNVFNARDKWGYYNGATSNQHLLIPSTGITGLSSVNREVNTQYITEGVLQRIDYPTGGYVLFDFEPNKYYDNGEKLAGGLRIKSMKSYDGRSTEPITKSYEYGQNRSGYGSRNFDDLQHNYSTAQHVYTDCSVQSPYADYWITTYTSNSAYGFDKSPVKYLFVTETHGESSVTPSTNNIGRVEYIFDNALSINDVNLVVPMSSKYFTNTFSWRRGKLTNKKTFDRQNRRISETEIGYEILNAENRFVGWGIYEAIGGNNSTCSGQTCENDAGDLINPNTFTSMKWYQNTGSIIERQVKTTTYDPDDVEKNVITKVSRVTHPDKLVTVEEKFEANNDPNVRITKYKYPFQLSANSNSTGSAGAIYKLNTQRVFTKPIEAYLALENSNGSNTRVVSGQISTYKSNPSNSLYVVLDSVFVLEANLPVSQPSTYEGVTINGSNNGVKMDPNYRPRMRISGYDSHSNPLSYYKIGDIANAFKYGYYSSMPTLTAVNATDQEIAVQNFEDIVPGNGVLFDPSKAHTGDQYYSGDYTMNFSMPNGKSYVVDYYYLDGANKWTYISKPYAGTSMILSEGLAIDDVRIYPKTAQVNSFSYDPIFGKTSETDTNGQVMFYEYDAFGRLKNVRDAERNILKTYDYQYAVRLKFNSNVVNP